MHPRAEAFAACARDRYGLVVDVHEFPEGTETAADAAAAIGCDVDRIASAIVVDAGGLVVAVVGGADRVSEAKLAALRDVPVDAVGMADPDEIAETLGWPVGGVPPFCYETHVPVYLDETLLAFDTVWAAAGTPEAVFPANPEILLEAAGGQAVDLAAD